jgi:hypothetical protein
MPPMEASARVGSDKVAAPLPSGTWEILKELCPHPKVPVGKYECRSRGLWFFESSMITSTQNMITVKLSVTTTVCSYCSI